MEGFFKDKSRRIGRILMVALSALAVMAFQPLRPVVVIGDSMFPTYHNGDVLWAHRPDRPLRRGDVVVVNCEWGRIIKRVARLQGEGLDQYLVNGEWITPSGNLKAMSHMLRQHTRRTIQIPEGQVYLLGDNSSVSVDSRQHGPFPMRQIEGFLPDPRPRIHEGSLLVARS